VPVQRNDRHLGAGQVSGVPRTPSGLKGGTQMQYIQQNYVLRLIYRGQRSQYSECLRAGRPRSPSSSPYRVKNFHFSILSRSALWSTQPSVNWLPDILSRG
jgi:hypothetical protein